MNNWTLLNPDPKATKPSPRTGHTLTSYRNLIVLYGGAGEFLSSIGLRVGFNDLWVFDTESKEKLWKLCNEKGFVPKKRMYHASATIGCVMLVMGGFNTEAKVVLDDFNLFDFRLNAWVNVQMSKANSGQSFRPLSLYDNDPSRLKDPQLLNSRKMHRICAVWDHQWYASHYKLEQKQDRFMWI